VTQIRVPARGLATLALAAATGCGGASVDTIYRSSDTGLPRPDRVLVFDFAAHPESVIVDTSPGKTMGRGVRGVAEIDERVRVAAAAQTVLAEYLVAQIRETGLEAKRAAHGFVPRDGTVLVQGRFVKIDQGSRAARTVLGFGSGSTEVRTFVQVYRATPHGPRLLEEFETRVTGSSKPGMILPVGIGAATGNLARSAAIGGGLTVASEVLGGVDNDTKRTSQTIAQRLSLVFARQGWISPGAVVN
jgi:hypothetical protein